MTTRSTSMRRLFATVAIAWILILILASRAFAQADIQSTGPLTDITVGDDLSCQVAAGGNDQFFGGAPGSCGTAVVFGGQAYGFQGSTDWANVSPATLSGSGTAQSPYQVTTTVQAVDANGAPVGVTVEEVDSYVVGNDYYETDLTLTNTSGSSLTNLKLYHVGDCTLNGDDDGFGASDSSSGSVACTQNPDNTPAGPFMEFEPITPKPHYMESFYFDVFDAIPTQSDFPDTADTNGDPSNPGTAEDNGEGIDWDIASLAPGAPQTFVMRSVFSSGALAVPTAAPPPPPPTTAPAVISTSPASIGINGAGVTGSVNPGGLPTTASFQYGLDPKYTGGGPIVYTQSTPAQSVGSDFSSHAVSTSLSGLVPNALYHVRLVAINSAGTTSGPDVTFTTAAAPAPSTPTLGKTFNLAPVSGVVLIKVNGVFVPLTELTQIPENTVINALDGTLSLTTAAGGPSPAHDAAAKGKKPKPKPKIQKGTFSGAIFKLNQTTAGSGKGLVTLSLVENAFKGAPSYSLCTKAKKAGDASAAAVSKKVLQLLRASAKGKFRTSGRYSAATVRGTKWTIADRCDGTLTHDITDSVAVTDFVHHKTIILHAGQSYLAKARK